MDPKSNVLLFTEIVRSGVKQFHGAHKFYIKSGFSPISQKDLPCEFEINSFDSLFFRRKIGKNKNRHLECCQKSNQRPVFKIIFLSVELIDMAFVVL